MKRFLLKSSVVLLAFAGTLCILICGAYKTELRILERDLTCPTNIVAAVVGDSRVETYFDPAEIPWMRNFGESATPLPITAQKARMVARLNPHLKILVIDVWPNNFFSCLRCPIGAASPFGCALLEIMTRKDMPKISDGFETRLIRGVMVPGLTHMLFGDENAKSQLAGGFFKNAKMLEFGIRPEYAHMMPFPPPESPYSLDVNPLPADGEIVLNHLLDALSIYDLKVVLTTTPILWIDQRWTKETLEWFENKMTEIAERHHVPWHNWLHEYQDKADYWADGAHFNDIGAKAFSREKRKVFEQYLAP